jgi:hypothetical protein
MRNRTGFVATVAILAAMAIGSAPVVADARGPILDYLRSTVKPLLDEALTQLSVIHTSLEILTSTVGSFDAKADALDVKIDAIATSLATLGGTLASADSKIDSIETTTAGTTRLVTVRTSFLTHASSANGVNLDVVGLLPYGRINRYTVSLYWGGLTALPPMTGQVAVINNVSGAGSALQLDPQIFDPSGKRGVMVPPYTGTNSFIQVGRGPDGLGEIEVFVNAFIEVEQ